jgi:hypothetical protein
MAAVLLTAGWAAAQTPAPSVTPPPVLVDPYLTPSPPAIEGNAAPSGYAPSARLAADGPDLFPAPYRVWASGDFLIWKIRNAHLPPLVSTLPVGVIQVDTADRFQSPTGGPPADGGLGVRNITQDFVPVSIESTPTFANGNSLNAGEQFGGRFTAGVWLDVQQSVGLEASGFFISNRSTGFQSTTGNSVDQFLLDFPFSSHVFVVTPGTPGTPGMPARTVTVTTMTGTTTTTTTTMTPAVPAVAATPATSTLSQTFPTFIIRQSSANVTGTSSTGIWGGEINARCTSPSLGAVSGLVGFRYLDLHENLTVNNSVQFFLPPGIQDLNGIGLPLDGNLPTSISYTTADVIRTQNRFYGGQVGLDLDMYLGRFITDLCFKTALGVMHQTVNVSGTTQTVNVYSTGTLTDFTSGGLLSSPLDLGNHSRNRIAFVPEINVKLGYQILPSLRAYVGYDFLYLSSIVRPGDQVGISGSTIQATVANTTQQITVTQPTFRYKSSDMTINGINFGAEFRY